MIKVGSVYHMYVITMKKGSGKHDAPASITSTLPESRCSCASLSTSEEQRSGGEGTVTAGGT